MGGRGHRLRFKEPSNLEEEPILTCLRARMPTRSSSQHPTENVTPCGQIPTPISPVNGAALILILCPDSMQQEGRKGFEVKPKAAPPRPWIWTVTPPWPQVLAAGVTGKMEMTSAGCVHAPVLPGVQARCQGSEEKALWEGRPRAQEGLGRSGPHGGSKRHGSTGSCSLQRGSGIGVGAGVWAAGAAGSGRDPCPEAGRSNVTGTAPLVSPEL